jgi:hypothetical protein
VDHEYLIQWWNEHHPDQLDLDDDEKVRLARTELLKQVAVRMERWRDE